MTRGPSSKCDVSAGTRKVSDASPAEQAWRTLGQASKATGTGRCREAGAQGPRRHPGVRAFSSSWEP